MSTANRNTSPQLNWKAENIDKPIPVGPEGWDALTRFAISARRQMGATAINFCCNLSIEYNLGGLHLVRRIDFDDGCQWLARLQLKPPTPESSRRLRNEVDIMEAVRSMSQTLVPQVFARASMLMEFIPADTAMDSFGYDAHRGVTPAQFREKLHAGLADIQAQPSSVRFPKIGSIICRDGKFDAWAGVAKFPNKEATIRARTPPDLVDEVLVAIWSFPSQLRDLARSFPFQSGPFPSMHTDLYSSNVITDADYNILSVIDWENALVGPWELVEFTKELSIVPPEMDGPLYKASEFELAMTCFRKQHVELVRGSEEARQVDGKLSAVLYDKEVQALAHAFWLYEDGRIGYYDRVLKLLDGRYIPLLG
ncbi:hypothetical protein B0H63DRAFT_498264 [Podospora didyma]|uniref:Aminoglycoside phosphotransferase domain-containing protein n=1 Tax=Podospora didyma TaxID=330526 RepID=A0AAE0JWT3_9PEZI|nr:hypothetical protein B0H63DRAFT_498264 [Podospora didyma]